VAVGANGQLSIPRVDIAFDCGAVVNPGRVRAQLEGAVVQGISLATLGEISFKAGQVEQTNFFHDYELTRIDAAPAQIRTHRLAPTDYDKPLGGVGACPGRRLHASLCKFAERDQRDALCKAQLQFHPRRRAGRGHSSRAQCHEGESLGAGQDGSRVHRLRQGQSAQDQHGIPRLRSA
jgi:hypothetical protein